MMRLTSLLFSVIAASISQAQTAGIAPEWDVKANMATLVSDMKRLEPLLKQVKPAEWVEKGAPEAYIRQLKSSQDSVDSLIRATAALANDPDRLTTALDAFFRMERMELLLGSLKEGVRRYQSSDIADELTTLLASNSVHRDRLRQHIADLAAAREQEFKVVDQEAQRCRAALSQPKTRRPERK